MEGDVWVTFKPLMPVRKLDPAKCAMKAADGDQEVDVLESIELAAAGGAIGTELPPDQEL